MIKKSKTKVLIIDDNLSILEYLKTVLGRYNFEIKTSSNGYDGLHEVAEFKPDIIFLDLMMPNIDGIQMLQLKKVLNDIKNIPVIVISANAGRNNVIAAIEAGAERVLAKPINIKQLKSAVDEVLGGNFFELEKSEAELKNEAKIVNEINEFKLKFDEYRDLLIDAIKRRDSSSIKSIAAVLKSYVKQDFDNDRVKILEDLENREYQRPSDWMFAEMKVKEIEQNLKSTVNQIY
jgi:DNA-binding response OmpR family regulator